MHLPVLNALRPRTLCLGLLLVAASMAAQPATMVRDLYPGSSPKPAEYQHSYTLVRSGALVYFTADAGGSGSELWRTDGTPAGTFLIADLTAESGPFLYGATENLTDVNGSLFFTTRRSGGNTFLWKTDGSASGTVLLLQGQPYAFNALVNVAGTLFFFNRTLYGPELWKSDGTPAGTVRVAGIAAPYFPYSGAPSAAVGNTLFFAATDAAHGTELWESDGTEAGTGLVKDIFPGTDSSFPQSFTALGTSLLFSARDGQNGMELWKSDGTEAGTVLVEDIRPGQLDSNPVLLTPLSDFVLFVADDGIHGAELWRTDGTPGGTSLVRDILPGLPSSIPQQLTAALGMVFFTANDGVSGYELWESDGTSGGTVRVADLYPGSGSSNPGQLIPAGSTLFFTARDIARGYELFKTDGTKAGTVVVKDTSVTAEAVLQGQLLFFGNDAGLNHYDSLWKSDGTLAGTTLVYSFDVPDGSLPESIVSLNGEAYFVTTGGVGGPQVWRSDGTDAGTQVLTAFDSFQEYPNIGTLVPGGNHVYFPASGSIWSIEQGSSGAVRLSQGSYPNVFAGSLYFIKFAASGNLEMWKSDGTITSTALFKSFPSTYSFDGGPFTAVGGVGYFIMRQGVKDELWKTDGTPAGTVLVKQLSSYSPYYGAYDMVGFNGHLFFTVDVYPSATIWISDGTDAGTYSLIPLPGRNKTVVNGTLFFAAGSQLWKSDGTPGGTSLVRDFPGPAGPSWLTGVANVLYLAADDGVHGLELWRSDGTQEGTYLVRDIRTGPDSSLLAQLTGSSGQLFFTASDAASGIELWKSDGTPAGTMMVKDINPGAVSSSPDSLADVGGTLLFAAFSPETGRELWKSDGSVQGTVLVKDINPSLNSSGPGSAAEGGGLLYFSAENADNGRELWRSDGTASGTVLVKDIIPGKFSSFPMSGVPVGGKLFFSAEDEALGFEPWTSDGTDAGTSLLKDIFAGVQSSSPGFFAWNGKVYISAVDGAHGRELWVTDGTNAGTTLFKDLIPGPSSSNPFGFIAGGPYLFFFANAPAGVTGSVALWRTDGTPAGTVALAGFSSVSAPTTLGSDTIFFVASTSAGITLWKSDGTPAGTQSVTVITMAPNIFIGESWRVGNRLLFFIGSGFTGSIGIYDLWRTDGTAAGTVLVKSGLELFSAGFPTAMPVGDVLFFGASDADHGIELWKSDGSPAGTVLVKDIQPGPDGSRPAGFLNVGGKLLFRANDGVHGSELWVSDGTEPGTFLLQDINPGPGSSWPGLGTSGPYSGLLTIAGTRVFFSATEPAHGEELWSMPMSAVCAPPPAPVIASSQNPSCSPVTLDAGPGYSSYLWSTGETTRTITVNPSAPTTYTVYVSDASGCRSSSSIVQMVIPRPDPPVASNNGPVCAGQMLQLNASLVSGALYQWTGPGGFTSSAQNPQIQSAPASASGIYSVAVIVNGCSSAFATTTAVVNPLPSAAVAAPSTVCPNAPGRSASVASAGPGAAYAWTITNGTITAGQGTNEITFTAGASGTVQVGVTVTGADGCQGTGTAAATIDAGLNCGGFFTIAPCRLADTRIDPGPSGGPALESNAARAFPVVGLCGIPPSATAVVVTFAVVDPDDSGDLRIYPAGGEAPLASSINFRLGIVRAGNGIIVLGADGQIAVQCDMASPTGSTHFLIDVYGYTE